MTQALLLPAARRGVPLAAGLLLGLALAAFATYLLVAPYLP